ncbi:MAG: hypothetical protein ACR2IK_04670 [Chloroflexota bacterium]
MPADDGSPGRLIAAMVGIVGILLLGSLAWSAVGALFSAAGEVAAAVSRSGPAPPKLGLGGSGPPSPQPALTPADVTSTPTSNVATPTPVTKATPEPTVRVTPTDEPATDPGLSPTPATTPSPTPSASGRSPWILLPAPAPDTRVQSGPQVIEVRGRGDSAISSIRLELDGSALDVSLEQRSESVWRGSSTVQVGAGRHSVRATVVDDQGRTGSFRWTFDAAP